MMVFWQYLPQKVSVTIYQTQKSKQDHEFSKKDRIELSYFMRNVHKNYLSEGSKQLHKKNYNF